MAWVTNFEFKEGSGRTQPSQVVGYIKVFSPANGSAVVQRDTLGSQERAKLGKQSQTLQLGREAARQLFDVLKQSYDFQ
jgi:hypothetical protein